MLQKTLNKMRARQSERGFTLIEILFVLALIAILSVLAYVFLSTNTGDAQQKVATANLQAAYRSILNETNGDITSVTTPTAAVNIIKAQTTLKAEAGTAPSGVADPVPPTNDDTVYVYRTTSGDFWMGYKPKDSTTSYYLSVDQGEYKGVKTTTSGHFIP